MMISDVSDMTSMTRGWLCTFLYSHLPDVKWQPSRITNPSPVQSEISLTQGFWMVDAMIYISWNNHLSFNNKLYNKSPLYCYIGSIKTVPPLNTFILKFLSIARYCRQMVVPRIPRGMLPMACIRVIYFSSFFWNQ